MNKLILIIPITVFIFIAGKTNMSNSEAYRNNKMISALMSEYSTEYNHNFKLASKDIEQTLYGKWQVGDGIGYSLKYDITGGALDNGSLEISKTHFMRLTQSGLKHEYKNPVFMYYNETLQQMANDELLADYSGIEGIQTDTMGTVVVAMAISPYSLNEYEFMATKFIIIKNHVIAEDTNSFYQLQRIEQ